MALACHMFGPEAKQLRQTIGRFSNVTSLNLCGISSSHRRNVYMHNTYRSQSTKSWTKQTKQRPYQAWERAFSFISAFL